LRTEGLTLTAIIVWTKASVSGVHYVAGATVETFCRASSATCPRRSKANRRLHQGLLGALKVNRVFHHSARDVLRVLNVAKSSFNNDTQIQTKKCFTNGSKSVFI
jgi:hypothetical protein